MVRLKSIALKTIYGKTIMMQFSKPQKDWQRVRQMSGLTTDGGTLFQTAFSKNDPYLFFNSMQTDSEKSEFTGLKELLESIFHLVRNPAAHTPKVNWKVDEAKALDILTLISFAHKYLDECHKIPGK